MARKGTRLSREDSSLEWESKQDMKMTCTDSNKAVAAKMQRNEWVWDVTRVTPQDYMRYKGQQWGIPENVFPVSGLPRGLSLIQIILSWFREDAEMEEDGLNFRHACGTSSQRSLVSHWLWTWTRRSRPRLQTEGTEINSTEPFTEAMWLDEIRENTQNEKWTKEGKLENTAGPAKIVSTARGEGGKPEVKVHCHEDNRSHFYERER